MNPEQEDVLRLRAPAKINLLLRVLGRRTDGYHDLETWMQKLDLYDDISLQLTEQPGISLHCDSDAVPLDETNLACRAAARFFSASRRLYKRGVEITLAKNIPAAAGLGGGSSDAGTVLRGLNRLAGEEFSTAQLVDLARPLGADVPYFAVEHQAVLATGIGDIMQPVRSLADCTFILLNPGFAVSTRWVFENFALTTDCEDSILPGSRKHKPDSLTIAQMHNDLESVTSRKFPEIGQMKRQLLEAGAAGAMMSGSGPTVFGVFPDEASERVDVRDAVAKLRQECQGSLFVARSSVGAWPSGQGTGF